MMLLKVQVVVVGILCTCSEKMLYAVCVGGRGGGIDDPTQIMRMNVKMTTPMLVMSLVIDIETPMVDEMHAFATTTNELIAIVVRMIGTPLLQQ